MKPQPQINYQITRYKNKKCIWKRIKALSKYVYGSQRFKLTQYDFVGSKY